MIWLLLTSTRLQTTASQGSMKSCNILLLNHKDLVLRHSNSSSVHHLHELGWQIMHHHLFLHQRHHRCRHSPPKFLLLHQGCRRKIRAQFQLPLPAQCLLCSNKHLPVLALSPATAPQTVKTCWLINLGHRQATCHPAQQCLKTRRRSSRRLFG